jgi:hypothetical protein
MDQIIARRRAAHSEVFLKGPTQAIAAAMLLCLLMSLAIASP